ncbi:hypothetical protein MCOR27_006674 [Pyricularia oryzae]|uniref:Mitochondrial outer membrane transport complex Sam37/metaxin N-terminal domain-containing protein n=2 Tax=Pyricularia TaxID=48558 RepID=A0ABQ8NGE5_PYRGI|nr:uncharacterized protein MGG_11282 [Pyricularia oryzae 70-15]KAH8837045.1 hypothetical protein MCOR01_010684 [Pyricularia oryzae]KAI6295702.1 hypothetical protein MCOR33_007445 [Pyricularia grisea]EHA54243.1 hypothetical protein MGG_11282 [Pyricularia oryzae 70-15]KAI6252797.1 hypothetical protein MCOR19_010619 [Pyricularia oryzae]KAI6270711.1 hypothetical protein MCOR26_008103 [Pyricularia oryzae]
MGLLRLYVWGPAFGLPSLDAECLAVIAYFQQNVRPGDYEIVASSPSAVPTSHLPALHDTITNEWAASYQGILDMLTSHPSSKTQNSSPDPSAAARIAHLTAQASPLLALSLYVSSANYAATTRPALSSVLPFPLGWTEAPARRRLMARRADHLGLSDLDTDADPDDPQNLSVADSTRKSFIPARLQPRATKTISSALTPEAKARFRLDAAAAAVLDVVAAAPPTAASPPSAYDCLAFGYLALMTVPDLPRPFLEEFVNARHPALRDFVTDARIAWFSSPSPSSLPWSSDRTLTADSPLCVASRLAAGCVAALPGGMGTAWSAWAHGRRSGRLAGRTTGRRGSMEHGEVVWTLGLGVLSASVVATAVMLLQDVVTTHRFGAPLQVFERVRRVGGLWAVGSAGAVLGGAGRQLGAGQFAR